MNLTKRELKIRHTTVNVMIWKIPDRLNGHFTSLKIAVFE